MARRSKLLCVAALALCAACSDPDGPPIVPLDLGPNPSFDITFADHLAELVDRAAIVRPRLPFEMIATSSYDRRSVVPGIETWFANIDRGHYLGTDPRGHEIMAEHHGPGALVRLWSANPNGTLRIYVDDEATPLVEGDMDALMDAGGMFDEPFAYTATMQEPGLRGANLYVPIPFARYVRVTHEPAEGARPLYWQVGIRAYEADVQVEPFRVQMLGEAARAAREALADVRPEQAVTEEILDWSGTTVEHTLTANGSGAVVEHFCLATGNAPAETTILELDFDGVTTVRAPLRDFMGGLADTSASYYTSLDADDSRWCARFPLPFATTATFRVISAEAPNGPRDLALQYTMTDAAAPERYFHAHFVRTGDRTDNFSDFTAAEVPSGGGQFIGLSLAANNASHCWWGEGDEKIYVDGEDFPSVFGTGTEDYFSFAWATDELFIRPFHGQPDADTGHGLDFRAAIDAGGTWWNYRWHQTDTIPFTTSLRFDMEVWHWCGTQEFIAPLSMAFTGFWYGNVQHAAPSIAPLSTRPGVLPVTL